MGIQMPQIPLRPGRPAFSKRTRFLLAVALVVVFVGILVGGAVLLHSSSKAHVVTIPAADRTASPALHSSSRATASSVRGSSVAGAARSSPRRRTPRARALSTCSG